MSIQFIAFDNTNGAIRQWGVCESLEVLESTDSPHDNIDLMAIDPIDDPPTFMAGYYVDLATRTVVARNTLTVTFDKTDLKADGIEQATMTGLPDCYVTIHGPLSVESTNVSDGTVNFTTDVAGDYEVSIWNPSYYELKVTLHAV